MKKEIGGNFCEELLISNRTLRDSKRMFFFDSGRSAIRYLLDLLKDKIKSVMLPQYVCESVLIPFVEKQYQITYYPVDTKLQLIRDDFEQLLQAQNPQLVLVQSYFGFDTLNKDRTFLKELSRKGIIVVEDITHILLSDGWRPCADYMIGSLRKWCAIPDGGILIKQCDAEDKNVFQTLRQEENIEFLSVRLSAQEGKRKFLSGTEDRSSDKNVFISLFDKSESILNRQSRYYTMSNYTRERIISVDWKQIAHKRKENYCVLRDVLKSISGIEIVFPHISDNTVPLYFPVFVDRSKRDSVRYSMRKNNILLPVIWPVPSFLTNNLMVEVKRIYEEILAIPCDQRYAEQEMCFIADNIRKQMRGADIGL